MKTSMLIILLSLLFLSCDDASGEYSYYIVTGAEYSKDLVVLFEDLSDPDNTYVRNYIIIQQITRLLFNHGEYDRLNMFLTEYVENHPDDPYNAYYLLYVAEEYKKAQSLLFSQYYYERILRSYPDLLVKGRSVHYVCLSNLIQIIDSPELKIRYYRELLSRFSQEVESGRIHYEMAKVYEQLGEWDLSIQAYKSYLPYAVATSIPGVPDAERRVRELIALYETPRKTWFREDLDQLVTEVKSAIWRRDASRLNSLAADVNFFVVSWADETRREAAGFTDPRVLGTYMRSSVIRYQAELDPASNNQEAYLQTEGWTFRIRQWYLYFRRVYFPADPEVHNAWEWSGIFLGQKP